MLYIQHFACTFGSYFFGVFFGIILTLTKFFAIYKDPNVKQAGPAFSFFRYQLKGHVASFALTPFDQFTFVIGFRSEEHTSELQSLMRISYAVFCLKKKTIIKTQNNTTIHIKPLNTN